MSFVSDRSPPTWKYLALGVAFVLPLCAAALRELDWVIELQAAVGVARQVAFAVIVLAVAVFTVAALRYRERGGWAIGGALLASTVLLCWGAGWTALGALDFFAPGYARSIRVAPDLRVEVYEGGWREPEAVIYLARNGSPWQRRLIQAHGCNPGQVAVEGRTLILCRQRCDLVAERCDPPAVP